VGFDGSRSHALPTARTQMLGRATAREETPETEGGSGRGGTAAKLHESAEAEIEHAVFMQAYIPTSLAGVRDAEEETEKLRIGGGAPRRDMYYAALAGMQPVPPAKPAPVGGAEAAPPAVVVAAGSAAPSDPAGAVAASEAPTTDSSAPAGAPATTSNGDAGDSESEGEDDTSDSEGEEGEGDEEGGADDGTAAGPAYTRFAASKEEKRAHKAVVKEEKREKRREKMPKHQKKRQVKGSSGKR